MLCEKSYLDLMVPFYDFVKRETRETPDGLAYYGTGEAGHWAVQSNFNVAGALAVLGTAEGTGLDREEVMDRALRFFRYNLRAHVTGTGRCSCGCQWGREWISILGLERMAEGQLAMEPFFTDEDRESFRKLRLDEADWMLDNVETVAGMAAASGKNKPESHFWNGSFLYRAALDYPDAPNREAYLDKSCSLLLNAISHPLDAASMELFWGKPLKDWNVGFNFTPNYSLDHHGYMNVGYSMVTLSHAAYLHFYCKARKCAMPDFAMHHVFDLWEVVRNFIFPDGRLLRIGGDTRARYCYCQMYLLPVLLMMEDLRQDKESATWEQGLLGLLGKEQSGNPDGSFFGTRLEDMRYDSRYYYTRLESDPFAVLGTGAWVRRSMALEQPPEPAPAPRPYEWHDDFHCADMVRTETTVRSAVRTRGPLVLAQPLASSDLAEWFENGFTRIGGHRIGSESIRAFHKAFPGGFINSGLSQRIETGPFGEGELYYPVASSASACAALPDGKTLLVLEYVKCLKEHNLFSLHTICWQIPNDVHNDGRRNFTWPGGGCELRRLEGEKVIDTGSKHVNVDGELAFVLGYGAKSWKICAPRESWGEIKVNRLMHTLYVDLLCGGVKLDRSCRCLPGEVLADTGYAVMAGVGASEGEKYALEPLALSGMLRGVEFTAPGGEKWRFAANFGETPAGWEGKTLQPFTCDLERI